MIAEYTEETLAKTYTWGTDLSGSMQGAGGVAGLLSAQEFNNQNGSFTTHYSTYDGNGNVSEYLDFTGATVAHYEYDSFGNATASIGAKADEFEYKFSTKLEDEETGFYYYGYRYYDPVTGRWPSRDPLEEFGGNNLYGFVGNDGVDRIDYLGMEPCTDCDGNLDNSTDCEWTGKKNPGRTSGMNFDTLMAHIRDRRSNPDHAKVHWDDICDEPRELNKSKDHENPSGGGGPKLSGNSAEMSIQTRHFWDAFLGGNYSWVWSNKRAEVKSESSADFCCCKPMD